MQRKNYETASENFGYFPYFLIYRNPTLCNHIFYVHSGKNPRALCK